MISIDNTLPNTTRVWVYQSNREFDNNECSQLNHLFQDFVASWESHGTPLKGAIELYYNRFIVVFVDENIQQATGCSIDKSVGLVKQIEQDFEVKLMDRMNLAYRDAEALIQTLPMAAFQSKIKAGEIDENTIVFNNLVVNKDELISKWEVPAKNSWHSNLLLL